MRSAKRLRSRSRLSLGVAALSITALLAGCAPEPVINWQPPQPAQTIDVRFSGSESATIGILPSENVAGEAAFHRALGVVPQRLRHDPLNFAARFTYIPGVPAFNQRVNELLWAALGEGREAYTPAVYPDSAGLADRGCLSGAATLPAEEVLADARTGTASGFGTAVVCEVRAAYAQTLVIAFRVVVGEPTGGDDGDAELSDTVTTLLVNLETGEVSESQPRWTLDAAAELWHIAADAVRRQAGALSTAPLSAPDDTQLAIAAEALEHAKPVDGALHATLGSGLFAEEFAGLGLTATTEPLSFEIGETVVRGWLHASAIGGGSSSGSESDSSALDAWAEALAASREPFGDVSDPPSRISIDCNLLPCVALTYDDGPSEHTPRLLDLLAAEQASATFYMLGGYAQSAPETVRRVADEGHEIGSHSMWHPDLTSLPLAEARASVVNAAELLRDISGAPVATFRPPYGEVTQEIIEAVGMPAVNWTIDPEDWRLPSADELYERTVEKAWPGAIVLMHDSHLESVTASAEIIHGLKDRGFSLVTVSELFDHNLPLGLVRGR